MQKWFTYIVQPPTVDATFHAKATSAFLAEKMGYRRLSIFRYDDSGESIEALNSRIDGITAGVGWGDLVVYQYPSYNGYRFEKTFISKMKARGCKVVLFIHDSDLVRRGTSDQKLAEEKDLFDSVDALITLSEPFNGQLTSCGVKTPMITKEFWSFPVAETDIRLDEKLNKELVFAGNISKSRFLQVWANQTELTAFGDKGEVVLNEKVHYGGRHYPEELIRRMPRNCFGLAWDNDIDNGGAYGTYTRYNCPEKIALYLSIGLPVFVWDQSAIAKVIEKYKLGYAVDSLDKIDSLLAALSEEDLHSLKARVNQFSTAIRDGFFMRQALVEAEKSIFALNGV